MASRRWIWSLSLLLWLVPEPADAAVGALAALAGPIALPLVGIAGLALVTLRSERFHEARLRSARP